MKYIISSIFILAVKLSCWAQVSISSNIGTDELVCPGSSTNYYIYLSGDASLCSATWQITNGLGNFYQDDNEGSSVDITWDDQKPNKVEVQASVDYIDSEGNCTSPENVVVTFEHVLRSVFQETIPSVGSSVNVPYCSGAQPTVTLSVGPMYIKNTGGIGQPRSTEKVKVKN